MAIRLAAPMGATPQEMPRYEAAPMKAPEREPGLAESFGKEVGNQLTTSYAQQAATGLEGGISKGFSALTSPTATAGIAEGATMAEVAAGAGGAPIGTVGTGLTTGAATGGMAALGTAVPYIGAGILAGKALGFFGDGTKYVNYNRGTKSASSCPQCGMMYARQGTPAVQCLKCGKAKVGYNYGTMKAEDYPGEMKYAMGEDTVPAMLTPAEAVIPAPAAQDPDNKPVIKRMIEEGRESNMKYKGQKKGYVDQDGIKWNYLGAENNKPQMANYGTPAIKANHGTAAIMAAPLMNKKEIATSKFMMDEQRKNEMHQLNMKLKVAAAQNK